MASGQGTSSRTSGDRMYKALGLSTPLLSFQNDKLRNFMIMVQLQPLVTRLLELSNDVESNPGPLPHRLVRPGFGLGNRKAKGITNRDAETNNNNNNVSNNVSNGNLNNNNSNSLSNEDLRSIIDKQNEQLQRQNEELKSLRKKIDDNDKIVTDFKSELSEVRKKWQSMGDLRAR